jgi:MoxR-like ATPase
MRPASPTASTIDPREYLEFRGPQDLAARLRRQTGYCIQAPALAALVESLESSTALLAEGKPGCGKSALADALSEAFNLPHFNLQSMEGLTLADILYSWDVAAQASAKPETRWTREHLLLGEVLAAFDHAARLGVCLLQIDEVDKLSERNQHMLLQLLQSGFADVPRLEPTSAVGITDGRARWPIVVLTSNDSGEIISDPLRSRCSYTWIQSPTPSEEVEILRARCPVAGFELIRSVVRLKAVIERSGDLRQKPGLREFIRLTKRLAEKGISELTPEIIASHACHLVKRRTDQASFLAAATRLAYVARVANRTIDGIVEEAFGVGRAEEEAA